MILFLILKIFKKKSKYLALTEYQFVVIVLQEKPTKKKGN